MEKWSSENQKVKNKNGKVNMIATIAVIAAIAEKKSSAIIWEPLSSERSDNDRQRLLSLRSLESVSYDRY